MIEETLWNEGDARAAFDQAGVGMAHVAVDGTWLRVNRRLAQLLGVDADDLLGGAVEDVWHPDDHDPVRHSVTALLSRRVERALLDVRCIRADDSILWAQYTASVVRDGNGRALYLVVTLEEADARKALESELKDQIAVLEARLRNSARELERSTRDLEQYAYVVSHDLKQPLRMVASFAELFAERYADDIDETGRQYIDFMTGATGEMKQLLDALLTYSRVTTQGREFTPTPLDASLQGALDALADAVDESGASVRSLTHLPVVFGDPVQLRQVFTLLIDNSIKYSGDRAPQVEVSVHDEDDRFFTVKVEDHGVGIPPESAYRVLVIFKRLADALDKPGQGVGLTICKRIIERHGGRLWVMPQLRGVAICFTLPKDEASVTHGDRS